MTGPTPSLAVAALAALLAAACTAGPAPPRGSDGIERGTALPPPSLPGR